MAKFEPLWLTAEPDVEQHQIGPSVPEAVMSLAQVAGEREPALTLLENQLEHQADLGLIIHH